MGRSRHRAGRKSDPDAKRKQTTSDGQGRAIDPGTPELNANRMIFAGDPRIGLDYPLDALYAGRDRIGAAYALPGITEHERDEGLRLTGLWWWRYGLPHASCAALYDRMVAGGFADDIQVAATAEESADELTRVRGMKRRLERMEQALRAGGKACFETVRHIAVDLRFPLVMLEHVGRRSVSVEAYLELARLKYGLMLLVRLRDAEDRQRGRRGSSSFVKESPVYT